MNFQKHANVFDPSLSFLSCDEHSSSLTASVVINVLKLNWSLSLLFTLVFCPTRTLKYPFSFVAWFTNVLTSRRDNDKQKACSETHALREKRHFLLCNPVLFFSNSKLLPTMKGDGGRYMARKLDVHVE